MDSAKNGRWIIPFKKFSMIRVNNGNKTSLPTRTTTRLGITNTKLKSITITKNIFALLYISSFKEETVSKRKKCLMQTS